MAFNPGIVNTEAPVEFKLELNVKVDLNGTDPDVVKERLYNIAKMAIEMDDVIGETTAEVDDYAINVFVVEEDETPAK